MHPILQQYNVFLVKEHVGMFKAASNYDIFDPASGNKLLECREENLGFFTKLLRFTDYKRMTPFNSVVRDAAGNQVIRVHRGVTLFLSKVTVRDEHDNIIGGFKQKFFSIGGAFRVLDANDQEVCALKGKWTGWDFKFEYQGTELAHVTKKWAGLGKELFTSADNYVLQISEAVPPDNPVRQLILGAVLCIDLVLKE
ncbi:MAG: RNAase [Planctomycetota bacterium]|nr:MAG: RNAase [Planctomycetota bacterium]